MFGNIVERIKTFIFDGERKVKVKEEHKNKLSSFWNDFVHGKLNERVSEVLNNLGVRLTDLNEKKQEIEENDSKEMQKETSVETQDNFKSQDFEEDSKEIQPPLQEIFTFKGSSETPKVPDTVATIKPEEEPELDKEPVSEELDEKVKEILECVKNDDKEGFIKIIDEYGYFPIKELVQNSFDKEQISEEENTAFIDMKNELYDEYGVLKQKDEEVEEPMTQEETEFKSSDIDLTDLTQFTYTEYVRAYREKNIPDKNADRFWIDLYNNNLPSDLLDEKTFISERKSQEDEKEQRKLENKNAEAEKKLAELNAKYIAEKERSAELEAKSKQDEAKLKEAREENVTLKQQMVDAESEKSDLKRENESLKKQLSTAQETSKKAQARSYEYKKESEEAKKAYAELENKYEKQGQELQKSKDKEATTAKKLKEMTAKMYKNIELAEKQISSVKDDDNLKITALSRTIIDSNNNKEEPEVLVESKAEPVPSKETNKIETKEEAQKAGEDLVKAIEQEAGEQETSKIEIKPAYVSGPNGIDSEKLKSALAGAVAEAQTDESSIKPKTR